MLPLLASAQEPAAAPELQFNKKSLDWDLSSFTESDLRTYGICQRPYQPDGYNSQGVPLKVLGAAVTYFAPGYKTSPAGHIGMRFIYCFGESLNDRLVELTRFSKNEVAGFERDHPEYAGRDTSLLEGRLYVKITANPASYSASHGGSPGYGLYQNLTNRNVYESWLRLSASEGLGFLRDAFSLEHEQAQRLQDGRELDAYDQFKNNCVTVVAKLLSKQLPPEEQRRLRSVFTPSTFFKRVDEARGVKRILYPSQRSLRMVWNKEDYEGNWKEKWLPAAETTASKYNARLLAYYPYGIASSPNLLESMFAGALNIPWALTQSAVAALTLNPDRLKGGLTKLALSTAQLVGWTFIHPAPTPWTEAELARLQTETAQAVPRVLDLLLESLQR